MSPDTLLCQHEAARLLGTTREHLRRLGKKGAGPPFSDKYTGNGVRYLVSDIVLWRAHILGEGPSTTLEVLN